MHAEPSQIFMGYGTIEALLAGRDPTTTQLYLFSGVLSHATQYGNFENDEFYLLLSLIDGSAVHYCRFTYGRAQVVSDHLGKPVGDCRAELERIRHRGVTLEACTKTLLSSRGFPEPREATPTFPSGLTLVGGAQDFADYNRDTNTFALASEARYEEASNLLFVPGLGPVPPHVLTARFATASTRGQPWPGHEASQEQIADGGWIIFCRTCRAISHNPSDVVNRYCGRCRVFHEDARTLDDCRRDAAAGREA